MKPARILVLAVALVAGLAAAFIASNSKPPEVVVQPPPAPTDAVLIAKKDLHRDDILDENSMQWKPMDNIPEDLIRKSAQPNAIDEKKRWTVVENIYKDDYLRPERNISKDPRSGLVGKLHWGKRAVSINIEAQGSSTAGGFILPGYTVDVVHIFQDEHFARNFDGNNFTGKGLVSQIILTAVPVLAIGQNEQVKNGEHVVTGSNATLEVTPAQAETILLAQRTGTLALILRSMSDANTAGEKNKHLAGDL